MINALIEKSGEWLVPAALGAAAWYGLNFAVITPRIVKVDFEMGSSGYEVAQDLPSSVRDCLRGNMAKAVLDDGRFEAAAYTATFKHYRSPYFVKLAKAESRIGDLCHVDEVRQEQQRRRALAEAAEQERTRKQNIQRAQQEAVQNTVRGVEMMIDIFSEVMK